MTAPLPTGSTAGSRRFWITLTIFALLNAAIWVGYHRWVLAHWPRQDAASIESFSTQSVWTNNSQQTLGLTWKFNIDMADAPYAKPPFLPPAAAASMASTPSPTPSTRASAPSASASTPSTSASAPSTPAVAVAPPPALGTITPPVPGIWNWTDARTLVFTPLEPLPQATRFTVTLQPDHLRSKNGFTLAQSDTRTFQTTPLQLLAVRQVAFDFEDRMVLELQFNDKVIPSEVARHLELIGPDHRTLPFTLHGEGAGPIVRIQTNRLSNLRLSPQDHYLDLTLTPGIAGASGPLGIESLISQRVTVSNVLLATELHYTLPADGDASLLINFNGEVPELEAIRPQISVEPPVEFTLSRSGGSNNIVALDGPFKPATRYLVKIAEAKGLTPATGPTTTPAPPPTTESADDTPPAPSPFLTPSTTTSHPVIGVRRSAKRSTPASPDASKLDPSQKYPRPTQLSVFVPDRSPQTFWAQAEEANGYSPGAYLGSRGNRTILAKAVNVPALRVSIERIYENNLIQWRNHSQQRGWSDVSIYYTQTLASKRIALENKKNIVQDVPIRIDDLLPPDAARDGAYRLVLSADSGAAAGLNLDLEDYSYHRYAERSNTLIITLSDIGLTSKLMAASPEGKPGQSLLTWAVSLSTGKPLPNVRLKLYSSKNQPLGQATTDDSGLARIDGILPATGEYPTVLTAEQQPDPDAATSKSQPSGLTWLDLQSSRNNISDFNTGGRPYHRSGYEAFVFTDRGVYRPGETIVLRAIVRAPDMKLPPAIPIRWQLKRPDGRDFKSTTVTLDADGAAEWRIATPDDVVSGHWSAQIGLPGEAGGGSAGMQTFGATSFQIEDFTPDRIKATAQVSGPGVTAKDAAHTGRFTSTDKPLLVDVQGDYLFGQPCEGLQSKLILRLDPTTFSPKEFSSAQGWVFSDSARVGIDLFGLSPAASDRLEPAPQSLDKDGHTQFEVDVATRLAAAVEMPSPHRFKGPWHIAVDASVIETGGRAISAYDAVEADALPYYLGIQAPTSGYGQVNKPLTFAIACVKPDGAVAQVKENAQVTIFTDTWNSSMVLRDGRYTYESHREIEPLENFPVRTPLSQGRGVYTWKPAHPGNYIVQVVSSTQQAATFSLYVSDGNGGWANNISRENPERLAVTLVPAEESPSTTSANSEKPDPTFKVGQKIKAIVRSPFPGRLLLTLETDTVLSSRSLDTTGTVTEVPLDLPEGVRPNGYITASVVRPIDPNAEWTTHRAFGLARFTIDSSDRKLSLTLNAPTEVRPNTTLDLSLHIADPAGRPVANSAIALVAVDEGILQLTGFTTPNPLEFYNRSRALGVQSADLYSLLMPEVKRPDANSPVGGGGGEGEDDSSVASVRHRTPIHAKRFRPVSLIGDIVHTDDSGNASVHLQVPEFIGQLRIMAVAYSGPLVGRVEGSSLVRSPLIVQSSFPRFLAPGDTCTAPLLVFNNTPSAGDVSIRIESSGENATPGPINIVEGRTLTLTVPAHGQAVAMTRLTAADAVGVSTLRITASLGTESYAEHLELPVRPASPMISRGDYLVATTDKPANITIPSGMLDGTTSLQLRITQRPILGLPEGLSYLERYPYGCLEQTTSTLFPLVYLSDIGQQIGPGVFDKERVSRKVQYGITRLISMQTYDGGLAAWPGGSQTWPWGSVYAAHFALEAEKAGHEVPDDFKTRLLSYVRSLLHDSVEPGEGTQLQAYACYVLALSGKPDRASMNRLGEVIDTQFKAGNTDWALPQARLHLALAWAAAGRKDFASGLLPETLPNFRTTRDLSGNIASPVRDQALLLNTLLTINPDHPIIPALAEKLASSGRTYGWYSTQENAFAIMALGHYFRISRNDKPYAKAELLIDDKPVAASDGPAPLNWSSATTPGNLSIHITGDAGSKAHIAWLQDGVPLEMPKDADHALKIRRAYTTETGKPLDITRLPTGTAVCVAITIEAPSSLSNLVIEDLLPAGLEVENPRLRTSAAANGSGADQNLYLSTDRLDIRDDRIILIGSCPAGISTHSYLARAVTPGTYIVPPIRGECMYDLSINSLSGGGAKMTIIPYEKKMLANAR